MKKKKTVKLRECPFDGKRPKIFIYSQGDYVYKTYISCECGRTEARPSAARAVRAWNTRPKRKMYTVEVE